MVKRQLEESSEAENLLADVTKKIDALLDSWEGGGHASLEVRSTYLADKKSISAENNYML